MSELLTAAKAVIDHWDEFGAFKVKNYIPALRAAVKRAEKQEAVGFEEWADNNNLSEYGKACSRAAWTASQHAERGRIKEIIKAIGTQGEHDQWFDACDKIMEKIDE